MIDLIDCDVFDEIFLRYKESYNCTLDALDVMREKDIDGYCDLLGQSMLKALKHAKKEIRKSKRMARLAERAERRKLKLEKCAKKPLSDTLPAPIDSAAVNAPDQVSAAADEVNANGQK